jgi:hypothetical protein
MNPPTDYIRIPDHPDYAVDKTGSVLRLNDIATAWEPVPTSSVHGRAHVRLRTDGKSYYLSVAELVLLTFVGPKPDGKRVVYLDNDSANAKLDNLAWGWANGKPCVSDEAVADILRRWYDGEPLKAIAKAHEVTEGAVFHIVKGRRRGNAVRATGGKE